MLIPQDSKTDLASDVLGLYTKASFLKFTSLQRLSCVNPQLEVADLFLREDCGDRHALRAEPVPE